MTDIRDGLYIIHWISGGTSLVAIGSMYSGRKWFAPTNWVSEDSNGPFKAPFLDQYTDKIHRMYWVEPHFALRRDPQ